MYPLFYIFQILDAYSVGTAAFKDMAAANGWNIDKIDDVMTDVQEVRHHSVSTSFLFRIIRTLSAKLVKLVGENVNYIIVNNNNTQLIITYTYPERQTTYLVKKERPSTQYSCLS